MRRSIQSTWQAQAKQTRLLFKRNRVCKATRPLGRGKRGRRFLRGRERFPKFQQRRRGGLRRQCSGRPLGAAQMRREPPQRRISADAALVMSGKPCPLCFWGAGKIPMTGSGSEAEPHAIFVFKGASTDVVPAAGRFRSTQRCCAPLPNRVRAKSIRIILSETRFLRLCHRLALRMFNPAHKTCESSAKRRPP